MLEAPLTPAAVSEGAVRRPRLGFLGVGWIGRHRMEAIMAAADVHVAAFADPNDQMASAAAALAPGAERVDGLQSLLDRNLDGVVIATPSALHAEQSIAALKRGVAVFCQKPLGRNAAEARQVVETARAADRLLGVDLSYRFTAGMQAVRKVLRSGELGVVHAVDLKFHNAYGPDKDWFYDPALSGGGCVMDLGVHLVDLALWALDFPKVETAEAHLLASGAPLRDRAVQVEDYAVATLGLSTGAVARLACSWRLQAGCDAAISAEFYGTRGGLALRNIDGSFYNFQAERFWGVSSEVLAAPPDEWGGRAAANWAARLVCDPRFDPQAEQLVIVSDALDRIYAAAR